MGLSGLGLGAGVQGFRLLGVWGLRFRVDIWDLIAENLVLKAESFRLVNPTP